MGQEISSVPTHFPKAFGSSNSTFLLVFHSLTVIQHPSPLVIELPLKGRIVIIKIMKKNKGHSACFCCRAADSAHHLHFLQLGRVSERHVRGR